MEFFEALIGCANKLFKPKQQKAVNDKIVVTDLDDDKQLQATASQNNMASDQKPESSTAKLGKSRGPEMRTNRLQLVNNTFLLSFFQIDVSAVTDDVTGAPKLSKEADEPVVADQQTPDDQKTSNIEMAAGNGEMATNSINSNSNKMEVELQEWIEKNHDFFINKLFPAAQHYEEINQRCFYWL